MMVLTGPLQPILLQLLQHQKATLLYGMVLSLWLELKIQRVHLSIHLTELPGLTVRDLME